MNEILTICKKNFLTFYVFYVFYMSSFIRIKHNHKMKWKQVRTIIFKLEKSIFISLIKKKFCWQIYFIFHACFWTHFWFSFLSAQKNVNLKKKRDLYYQKISPYPHCHHLYDWWVFALYILLFNFISFVYSYQNENNTIFHK